LRLSGQHLTDKQTDRHVSKHDHVRHHSTVNAFRGIVTRWLRLQWEALGNVLNVRPSVRLLSFSNVNEVIRAHATSDFPGDCIQSDRGQHRFRPFCTRTDKLGLNSTSSAYVGLRVSPSQYLRHTPVFPGVDFFAITEQRDRLTDGRTSDRYITLSANTRRDVRNIVAFHVG